MKFAVLILCVLSLSAVFGATEKPAVCKDDDCFCKERAVMKRLSKESGRKEFLLNQKDLTPAEFKTQCDKTGKKLRTNWNKMAKDSQCDQLKVFVKKRLVLWDFFCSIDPKFREEFEGEFFEKFEGCDKIIYDTCITAGVDYCEAEPSAKLLKCVEEDMKDKCENSELFTEVVRQVLVFLKDNNRCGDKHPAALNHHKKPKNKKTPTPA